MPSTTFVDSLVYFKKLFSCRCLKRVFSIKSLPSWNWPPLLPKNEKSEIETYQALFMVVL